MNRRIESEADMLKFGSLLAAVLEPGDVIALTGDLGAGKTTLSRGMIQSLSGEIEVPSPTYTIVQAYDMSSFELWHCDLYRLERPEDVFELGLLDMIDDVVSLIEWPERMGEYLPDHALTIIIEFDGDGRQLSLSGPEHWARKLANV